MQVFMGLMDNRCVIHVIHQDIHDHLRKYISSNINEVIRAVLNSLFFFYRKTLHAPKVPKASKASKAQKSTKSTKRTKKHQKHKKHKKHINANKQISDFFPLRYFLCA